jgi:hypothetical protein
MFRLHQLSGPAIGGVPMILAGNAGLDKTHPLLTIFPDKQGFARRILAERVNA